MGLGEMTLMVHIDMEDGSAVIRFTTLKGEPELMDS